MMIGVGGIRSPFICTLQHGHVLQILLQFGLWDKPTGNILSQEMEINRPHRNKLNDNKWYVVRKSGKFGRMSFLEQLSNKNKDFQSSNFAQSWIKLRRNCFCVLLSPRVQIFHQSIQLVYPDPHRDSKGYKFCQVQLENTLV